MPWDSPVNFRNIKGPDIRRWLSSRVRRKSCEEGGGWDSMRIEKHLQVLFDLHRKKEIKTNYLLQDFIFEWMSPLNDFHINTFKKLKMFELLHFRVCDVLGIWCDVWWKWVVVLKGTRCVVFLICWTEGSEEQKHFSSLSGSPVLHKPLLLWQTESSKLRAILYFAQPQEAAMLSFIVSCNMWMTGLNACVHTDTVLHGWEGVWIVPNSMCLCSCLCILMWDIQR